jgi:hypothetical protein
MSGRDGVDSLVMTSREPTGETGCLLESPANASRLIAAANDVLNGRPLIPKTMGELRSLAADDS